MRGPTYSSIAFVIYFFTESETVVLIRSAVLEAHLLQLERQLPIKII